MELEEGAPGVGVLVFANLIAAAVVVSHMGILVAITSLLREAVFFSLHVIH